MRAGLGTIGVSLPEKRIGFHVRQQSSEGGRTMNTREGKLTAKDGLSLYWKAWIPDGAPKAVLHILHGYAEHVERYRNVVHALVPAGYAVFGESYYMEGNIERAIIEYDKVIKNYPKGEMIPHALLKQGLSFQKIGDKTGARILLEKLVDEFPDSHQAKLAASTLATLK
jgi:tetratricopeptide (TPR) repeat protein